MAYPYLDLTGFRRRTTMPESELAYVETKSPGYIAQRISTRTSYIHGRLRKRYGNSLPFGQGPAPLIANIPTAPGVTLMGTPTLGSQQLIIDITANGIIGTAQFQWSSDNGVTWTTGVQVQPTVTLGNTGLTAGFSVGTYATSYTYMADTPVPEIVLSWLVVLVTYDAYRKRGMNPQDPAIELLVKDYENAEAELKEAATSETGLFDLPFTEPGPSAITTGGPRGYSETSPYKGFDIEARKGYWEDYQDFINGDDDRWEP